LARALFFILLFQLISIPIWLLGGREFELFIKLKDPHVPVSYIEVYNPKIKSKGLIQGWVCFYWYFILLLRWWWTEAELK
jgi:hypothetical protein